MANSTVVKNFLDGQLTLSDGTGSPVTHVVDFDQGDFSISGLSATQREVAAYESRGVLKTLRHTSRTYPSGSFTVMLSDITDASDATMVDFLLKQGSFSGNASTVAGDVYCIDLILDIEGTDLGDDDDETITLTDCYCTVDISEGDPSVITVNYTCYGTVTMAAT